MWDLDNRGNPGKSRHSSVLWTHKCFVSSVGMKLHVGWWRVLLAQEQPGLRQEYFSPSWECWCPRGGKRDPAVQCMVLISELSHNEVAPASVTTRCFMTWILALHKDPQRRMCVYVVYVCLCGLCMYMCSVSLSVRVCVCSMCMVCSIM